MKFVQMWWCRVRAKLSPGSPPELKEWAASLRKAAAAELPPTMDSDHRARLVLGLVDAMRRAETPTTSQGTPVDEAQPATVNGSQAHPPVHHQEGRSSASPTPAHRQLASSNQPRWSRHLHRVGRPLRSDLALALVVLLVAAGGVFSFLSAHSKSVVSGVASSPTIRVGVLPVVDVAPFYRAVGAGYFRQAGLNVEVVTLPSGPAAMDELVAGRIQVAFSSYPGMLSAEAMKRGNVTILAAAYTAPRNHLMLVASPKGTIQSPEDVPGKKIAVTSTGTISDLAIMYQLREKGIEYRNIQWIPMDMRDMGRAMQRGDVDGAVLAEPYITLTSKEIHAKAILDGAVDKTADIPISGYATLNQFKEDDPRSAAAFVWALNRGVDDVADRSILESVLIKDLKIDRETAQIVRPAPYPKKPNLVQIQAVADLMRNLNKISESINVRPMLFTK